MCPHSPRCPEATASDRDAARVVVDHHEQGWALLCNGVVVFDDTGELLPDGCSIAPHRASVSRRTHVQCRLPRQVATLMAQPA